MKNLNKLWDLWKSENQELVIQLIKSQGLDLYDVLFEFWHNYAKKDFLEVKTLVSGEAPGPGMLLYFPQNYILVFEDNYNVGGVEENVYYWSNFPRSYIQNNLTKDRIIKCNSIEEANQKAILKFIEIINKIYK